MAAAPDTAVVAVLAAAGLGLTAAPAAGANLFAGPVRRPSPTGAVAEQPFTPHKAVFCLATGGPAPISFVRRNTGPDVKRSTVQVRVRSEVNEFGNGQTLARGVWTALQRVVVTGYMSITVRESEPVYLGEDATNHHEWSINLETWREE